MRRFLQPAQNGATAQVDPALQNAIQVEAAPAGPVAATGQPAVVETPKKLGKSPIEVTEKEALPERELNPELLTSRSLSQPGAETAAGDTSHNDASASNRQDARPEGAEIVRGLKSGFATGRETPQVQPAVHEVQESKSNVTHHVPEFASSIEKQGATANTSSEAGFTPVAATETASPILSAPATLGTPAIGEPTAKVAGASHSNGNWSQVEKAQVVSQIVERAHLLGQEPQRSDGGLEAGIPRESESARSDGRQPTGGNHHGRVGQRQADAGRPAQFAADSASRTGAPCGES